MSAIYIFGFCLCFLFVAMGLYATTTELNLTTRTAQVTRKDIRGARYTEIFPLDWIRITAMRMGSAMAGRTHISQRWIVRAGFLFEESNVAIVSEEVDSEKECTEKMLELYRFFFPSRTVSEKNIITNGNEYYLYTDEDIAQDQVKQPEQEPATTQRAIDSQPKWDSLIGERTGIIAFFQDKVFAKPQKQVIDHRPKELKT